MPFLDALCIDTSHLTARGVRDVHKTTECDQVSSLTKIEYAWNMLEYEWNMLEYEWNMLGYRWNMLEYEWNMLEY